MQILDISKYKILNSKEIIPITRIRYLWNFYLKEKLYINILTLKPDISRFWSPNTIANTYKKKKKKKERKKKKIRRKSKSELIFKTIWPLIKDSTVQTTIPYCSPGKGRGGEGNRRKIVYRQFQFPDSRSKKYSSAGWQGFDVVHVQRDNFAVNPRAPSIATMTRVIFCLTGVGRAPIVFFSVFFPFFFFLKLAIREEGQLSRRCV